MRTCVIGGAGFIGSEVTRQLTSTGRDVVVVGRSARVQGASPQSAAYVVGDYGDRGLVRKLCAECDEVIDLAYATVPQTSFSDPMFDMMANLPPSIGLLEEASRSRVKRVLIVSSGGTVYGAARRLPLVEDDATQPLSPYGITKLTIEKYALMYHALHGLDVCVVRPGNAFGVGQRTGTGQGFIAAALAAARDGVPITVYGPRGTIRDYVYVTDIAAGILATLEHGVGGQIYNVGTGIGRDNMDVVESLRQRIGPSGRSLEVRQAPARGFDVLANVLDCGKLQRAAGWRPQVAFEDGLRLAWEAVLSGDAPR